MSVDTIQDQSIVPVTMLWSTALGGVVGSCIFKQQPEDFCVEEQLAFEPDGCGEHLYLLIKKKAQNTESVAALLARQAGVRRSAVSYAGRKDRQSVACQWFCVSLPGQPDPDWGEIESDNLQILRRIRHKKKLKRGALKGNSFVIRLREVQAECEQVEQRLSQIAREGVPNYYGVQRFGFEGRNVCKALDMFSGRTKASRNQRSIYLSAVRSWLFNQVLSMRVKRGVWKNYLAGDVLGFSSGNSLIYDPLDQQLELRLQTGELSPTAPLWGRGLPQVSGEALELEQSVVEPFRVLSEGLEQAGLQQERRVTRMIPREMSWEWDDTSLLIRFRLPKGCFATSLLSELVVCREAVNL